MSDLLDLARRAGLGAAELVRQQRPAGRVPVVDTKSSDTDVVTAIDRASEEFIRATIVAERPFDSFLGEEGEAVDGTSSVRWIIDPIDGTVNFMYGLNDYAVSIAAERDGEVVAGYVANIATGEEFAAEVGGGAWRLDGEQKHRLTGPPASPIHQLLVATGFSYEASIRASQGAAVAKLLPQVRDIRRRGAAALDLVAVAAGQVDAYVEQGLNPWDMAAGALICAEAGVVVAGYRGGPAGKRLTAAAHPDVAKEYFELIEACGF